LLLSSISPVLCELRRDATYTVKPSFLTGDTGRNLA